MLYPSAPLHQIEEGGNAAIEGGKINVDARVQVYVQYYCCIKLETLHEGAT